MSSWASGALAAVLGPALLIGAVMGALAGIRPATSAPAAAVTLDSEEQQFLNLINDYRGGQGLPTLSIDPQLEAASRWMSTDMATNDYFSHYDSLGRDPFQRMAAFGYDYNVWKGENLAAGTASAQVAFDLWKASPGHNSNMTNPNFLGVGIARAYDPNSGLGWYWTTDFGGIANAQPPAYPTVSPTPAPSITPTSTPSPQPTPTARTTQTPAPQRSDPTPSPTHTALPTSTPR
ncbi:MAG TPA: CAP domain-containing protein [Dehalococcoidia bacterium]|nr:CAP domain-containing protein [Dehalococcoidia bacterium]